MDSTQNNVKGIPLSVIAESKEILSSLRSTVATSRINTLFMYLRQRPEDDLRQTPNLIRFLQKCVTREVVDKIKDNHGTEETEKAYKMRISQDVYNTSKITEDIRLGMDKQKQVHFYVRFGKEKDKECEVTTEDTLKVVSAVYNQFIIELEEQEKMLLEYVLTGSQIKKTVQDEEKDQEIFDLKRTSEEMEKKNNELQQELLKCKENIQLTLEEKNSREVGLVAELDDNKSKLRHINALLKEKVQKEAMMQINIRQLQANIAELQKSLVETQQKNKELVRNLEVNKHDKVLHRQLTLNLDENEEELSSINHNLGAFRGFVSQCLDFKRSGKKY